MAELETRVERLESKLEMFMRSQDDKFNNFINEMRQQNQMRANEIRDLQKRQDEERRKHDADMKELQKRQDEERRKHDADMKELQKRQDAAQRKHEDDMREVNKKIDNKFDKLSDQIHTMTIAAVVGFGAIAAAVGGLVFAAFR